MISSYLGFALVIIAVAATRHVVQGATENRLVELMIIPVFMIAFSLGGATFGMAEEVIPMILIFVPLVVGRLMDGGIRVRSQHVLGDVKLKRTSILVVDSGLPIGRHVGIHGAGRAVRLLFRGLHSRARRSRAFRLLAASSEKQSSSQ